MSLGTDLRMKYLRDGKSRRGIGQDLGVPESVLRRFESGDGVHPKHAVAIADYLEVDVTDLPQFAAMKEQA